MALRRTVLVPCPLPSSCPVGDRSTSNGERSVEPQLLVCDHFEIGPTKNASREHGGRLPQENIDRYRERLKALRAAPWAAHLQVLELESWHGFGLACRRALELVRTPLVFVVQHDMAFRRRVDLTPVAQALLLSEHVLRDQEAPERVNFVSLLKTTTVGYRERVRSRHKLEVGAPVATSTGGSGAEPVMLTRMPQFFDCMHMARVPWYREIFTRPLLNGAAIGERTRGEFTENNLGLHMLRLALADPSLHRGSDVSAGVLAVSVAFGGWLYDDGGQALEARTSAPATLA